MGKTSIWFCMAITLSLFLMAKLQQNYVIEASWLTLSQLISLLGTTLLAISFILSGRFKWVEDLFGGLDKVYKLHHITGGVAFVLLLHHPMFLALNALPDLSFAWKYLFFSSTMEYNWGVGSLYLMLSLLVLTLLINLPYSIWKKTHEFMGLVLLGAGIHILTISSDVSRYQPLRWWMICLLSLAGLAVIYRRFLYNVWGPRYKYLVSQIEQRGDVILVSLRAVTKKILYWPGQFAFALFPSVSSEQHPYSFSCTPGAEEIKFGIKVLGDDTLKLKEIKVGDEATIWGPYGHFFEKTLSRADLILIAGGIGITPFISIIQSEVEKQSERKIDLFYCVKTTDEAIFDEEIKKIIGENKNINYWQYCSGDKGRITAKSVVQSVGSLDKRKILLCGPVPMMVDLTEQFKSLGVKNKDVIFEDFNFK